MNCEKTRESLSLYIDCKLDDVMMQQVKNHLDTCTDCRSEFEHISEVVTILNELPEMPLPDGLNTHLHQALITESKWVKSNHQPGYIQIHKGGRRTIALNWKHISAVSAVFIVLLSGVALHSQGFFSQIYDALYSADTSYELAAGESDSVDLFLEVSPEETGKQQMAMGLEDEENNRKTEEITRSVEQYANTVTPAQNNQAPQNNDPSSADVYTMGGDRGVLLQRQLPEPETTEEDGADAEQQTGVEHSVNRHTVEARLQDTFSLHYVDAGTLQYSLNQYKKIDEQIEIFVYNIQGSKDGLPISTQITIRADSDGLSMLP